MFTFISQPLKKLFWPEQVDLEANLAEAENKLSQAEFRNANYAKLVRFEMLANKLNGEELSRSFFEIDGNFWPEVPLIIRIFLFEKIFRVICQQGDEEQEYWLDIALIVFRSAKTKKPLLSPEDEKLLRKLPGVYFNRIETKLGQFEKVRKASRDSEWTWLKNFLAYIRKIAVTGEIKL